MKNNRLASLMLPQFTVGVAETAFNHLIAQSPKTLPILRKLAGKILQIQLNKPDLCLFFIFSENRCDWLSHYEGEADCTIHLDAISLPQLANKSQLTELINQRKLVLHGDIQVLQQFTALLDELEKDPAELLSRLIGDVPAQISITLLGKLGGKIRNQFHQDCQNMVENLMVERPVLVHRLEAVDFYDQIDELAQQAVRLEQKFATLGVK